MQIDAGAAATLLAEQDNIVIFCHRKPDGDTIGSGFALFHALEAMGKTVRIECADPINWGRFPQIFGDYAPKAFPASFLVAVDVADEGLLMDIHKPYNRQVDLCIDHHKSNSLFARHTVLDATCAAAAELIYRVVAELGIAPNPKVATGVFTGITTDTGCFRHANVTPDTHRIAAEMLAWGADGHFINQLMFENKTKGRMQIDKLMMDTIEFHFADRCAVVFVPADLKERFHVTEEELDGISAFPRTIEGVLAGVTIRDKGDGSYRVSLRSRSPVDSSRICREFGGGGHTNAAGCTITGTPDEVKQRLLAVVEAELNRDDKAGIPHER
ncbi:bifunctional oligoribonuclease/PAP phosphatase NrnA [Ruminococcaceae bacterium OttesenSCG-928-L11]|nr:bifunctional oligoribonuclease/PAP phosphatase NrnA [Ruminococcaceae bacterium OttesenSCG-928-L11]